MYAAYAAVAPDVDAFPTLIDKTGDLLRTPYDWTDEVKAITATTHYNLFGVAHLAPIITAFLDEPGEIA